MALRIAGMKKEAPPADKGKELTPKPKAAAPNVPSQVEDQAGPEDQETETEPDTDDSGQDDSQDASGQGSGAGVLDPTAAGYKQPEQGPFMCGNCMYFAQDKPNTCQIVSGYIDEMAVCNVFSSSHQAKDLTDTESAEPSPDAEAPEAAAPPQPPPDEQPPQ